MARAGLTTERLVQAGARLADEQGFEAVTVSALARMFGVQVASLYSHILNTHDLKSRIGLVALDMLASSAADAVAGRAGKNALIGLAQAHRNFAMAHPGLFAAARYPADAPASADHGGVRLSRLTRASLAGYHLTQTDETHAIRLLGSYFLGFSTLELSGSFSHSTPQPDVSWLRGLDAIDAALVSWSRDAR